MKQQEKNEFPNSKKVWSIFIVNDQFPLQGELISILSSVDWLNVIGEAESGRDAINQLEQNLPDLILLVLNSPQLRGLAAIAKIKESLPNSCIFILSAHREEKYVLEALRLGADGYCLQGQPKTELLFAIQTVLSGRRFIGSGVINTVVLRYLNSTREFETEFASQILSSREKNVLKLISEGFKTSEIGELLCISKRTVEKHKYNMMKKLQVQSAPALIMAAIGIGLIAPMQD